jgi:hypothetical protein
MHWHDPILSVSSFYVQPPSPPLPLWAPSVLSLSGACLDATLIDQILQFFAQSIDATTLKDTMTAELRALVASGALNAAELEPARQIAKSIAKKCTTTCDSV